MITTNEMGLPEAFVNFVSNVRHNAPGTLSATTLLQGDKQIVLFDRHFDELTQDAADQVWASFGTAFHLLMEKQKSNTFKEEAFEVPVDDWKVTGHLDSYDMEKEIIEDWKTTSVWKVIKRNFDEWRAQGLTYAWLLKHAGLEVQRCRFIAMLKDWSKAEAKRKPDYPQRPVYIYEFDVTDEALEETDARIRNKIKSVTEAYKLQDDEIPACTPEERWDTETKYAVMKKGRQSAVKLCDDRQSAEAYMANLSPEHYIQERPGEHRRCQEYCPCAEFCNFYHENVEKPEDNSESA